MCAFTQQSWLRANKLKFLVHNHTDVEWWRQDNQPQITTDLKLELWVMSSLKRKPLTGIDPDYVRLRQSLCLARKVGYRKWHMVHGGLTARVNSCAKNAFKWLLRLDYGKFRCVIFSLVAFIVYSIPDWVEVNSVNLINARTVNSYSEAESRSLHQSYSWIVATEF